MDSLWQDFHYTMRGLRNQPAFAALAVLTLALGIGAITAMFSVIQNVLLDPFPYKDADRIVFPQIRNPARPQANQGGSYFQTAEFLEYQEKIRSFEEVIASGYEEVLYTTAYGTELLVCGLQSVNTFAFLGVPAMLGRTLAPADGEPGAPPAFVLAHKGWMKFFNGDPQVVGQTFVLNGVPTTLVGVMPPRYTKLAADCYKPLVLDRANKQLSSQYWRFQARLKPGVTPAEAEAELRVLAPQIAKLYPRNYPQNFTAHIVQYVDYVVGGFKKTLYTLGAAVGLLLLIACGNVANMLLARGAVREKEIAVRAALGATRGRLVRQLLLETAVLALLGAAVGCGFAHVGLKLIVAMIPEGAIPREADIRLNGPVLLFSVGVAVFTALLAGLMPAWQTTRISLVEALKDTRTGGGGGFHGRRFRHALIIGEIALSLVLLTGAGLMMRTLIKLQTVPLGFDAEQVLYARVPLPRGQYQTVAARQRFFSQLLARVSVLPGVTVAATGTSLPPWGWSSGEVDLPGKTHAEKWNARLELCCENYFRTLGLRLVRGRGLSETDVADARRIAVVNQAFVDRYLGGDDPLGRHVKIPRMAAGPNPREEDMLFEIAGVVASAKNAGLQDAPAPSVFLPFTVTANSNQIILVRAQGSPLGLLQPLRTAIWAQDRNVAITNVDTLANYIKNYGYAEPRFTLFVLGVFAVVGLVLVVLGVYSVVSYTVSRQTHELGIRMALGASRAEVLRFVLWRGARLIAVGIVVGILASLAVTRILASQLWQTSPHDPTTLAGVAAIVALAGLAACYVPARRATRVDPLVALRCE